MCKYNYKRRSGKNQQRRKKYLDAANVLGANIHFAAFGNCAILGVVRRFHFASKIKKYENFNIATK